MKITNKGNYSILLYVALAVIFLFALMVSAQYDVGITLDSPANGTVITTANGTTLFFNCTATNNSDDGLKNLSLFFGPAAVGYPVFNQSNATAALNSITYQFNITGVADGTYFWNCQASNTSGGPSGLNQSNANRTITIDTVKPSIFEISPNVTYGIIPNFTSMPVTFIVHVNETSNMSSAFFILNSAASGAGLNDSDVTNTSNFMTLRASSGQTYVYTANLTLNYTSSFTNPGAHSVYFCANDTGNNLNCSRTAMTFIIKGVNASELERLTVLYYSVTMNITLENGSDVDSGLMAPTVNNYTLIFNKTADKFVSIVGMSINESHLRDVGNTQVNESVTSAMQAAVGSDFTGLNSTFMNISSFLPQGTLYRYGIIEFDGGSWEKMSYCTGTIDSPTCVRINPCNTTTNISVSNYSSIPVGGACYARNLSFVTGVNTGRTYIYTDTFSGAAVGNDSVPPIITFVNLTNMTIITEMPMNFNVTFTDSSGINNNSINITINETIYSNLLGHGVNITCTPNTNASTTISCNISLTLNDTRGAYINITAIARDSSLNINLNTSTAMFNVNTTPRVALVAPAEGHFFSTGFIVLNYTPHYDNGIIGCKLWGNFSSASFTGNQTNSSALTSDTPTNFSGLNLRDGSYIWNVMCNDTDGNYAFNATNRTFTVDLTDPSASISASPTTINRGETVTVGCSGSDNIDTAVNTSIRVLTPTGDYSSDTDGSFSDTSTSGTYTASCTTTDDALRTATVSTTFVVNTPSGGTGGSSGSSGGGASGSTLSTSTSVYSLIKANVPMESKLSNTETTGVEAVVFTASEDLFNVKVGISQLNSLPSAITNLPVGEVFKYILVSTTNLPDAKITNASIKFHVDKSWLTENGLSSEDVVLKRYNSNAWGDLKTEILNEDSARVYYAATTPGMSYFVIASKANAVETTAEEETTQSEEGTTEETPGVILPSEVVVAEKSSKTWLWVLLGILLVGGVVVAVTLLTSKNKKRRY